MLQNPKIQGFSMFFLVPNGHNWEESPIFEQSDKAMFSINTFIYIYTYMGYIYIYDIYIWDVCIYIYTYIYWICAIYSRYSPHCSSAYLPLRLHHRGAEELVELLLCSKAERLGMSDKGKIPFCFKRYLLWRHNSYL